MNLWIVPFHLERGVRNFRIPDFQVDGFGNAHDRAHLACPRHSHPVPTVLFRQRLRLEPLNAQGVMGIHLPVDVRQAFFIDRVSRFLLLRVTHKHQFPVPAFLGESSVKLSALDAKPRSLRMQRHVESGRVGQDEVHALAVHGIESCGRGGLGLSVEWSSNRAQQPQGHSAPSDRIPQNQPRC